MWEYLCVPVIFHTVALLTFIVRFLLLTKPEPELFHNLAEEAYDDYMEAVNEQTR